MTRGGIEYNFKISPFKYTTDNKITFVFSSKKHLKSFIERYENNRKRINDSLSNRFNFYLELNSLADCVLYAQIEQRGFLIIKDGTEYKCQNTIKFVGENPTKKK